MYRFHTYYNINERIIDAYVTNFPLTLSNMPTSAYSFYFMTIEMKLDIDDSLFLRM